MGFRCVECGFRLGDNKPLFIQYSPGNIRLMKCENCKAVANQYIECEVTILLIDLILHKPKAYRHLLFNLLNHQVMNLEGLFLKSAFAFFLLDGYMIVVSDWNEEGWGLHMNFDSLFWRCGKMLTELLLGNFVFLCSIVLMTRFFLHATAGVLMYKEILMAIFISSYFKFFLITMMVWEFPLSVLSITNIFVLSSNTVALNVITESSIENCIGVCLIARGAKFFISWVLDMIISPNSLKIQDLCWKSLLSRFSANQSFDLGHLLAT